MALQTYIFQNIDRVAQANASNRALKWLPKPIVLT